MGNHCLLAFTGELSFQGFLGGSGFRPPTVGFYWFVLCRILSIHSSSMFVESWYVFKCRCTHGSIHLVGVLTFQLSWHLQTSWQLSDIFVETSFVPSSEICFKVKGCLLALAFHLISVSFGPSKPPKRDPSNVQITNPFSTWATSCNWLQLVGSLTSPTSKALSPKTHSWQPAPRSETWGLAAFSAKASFHKKPNG